MVYPDAHCRTVLLADVEERHEAVTYLLQLLPVFFFRVFQFLEYPGGIDVIAWVYPHFFAV